MQQVFIGTFVQGTVPGAIWETEVDKNMVPIFRVLVI